VGKQFLFRLRYLLKTLKSIVKYYSNSGDYILGTSAINWHILFSKH